MTPAPKDPVKYDEYRKKISVALKGRSLSEDHRIKIGESNKGIKRSKETCAKNGDAKRGKHLSLGHREKIANALKGRKLSKDHRVKIGDGNKGKHISLESRMKMSTAKQGDKSVFWKGGMSFAPYCQKFNREFKERVRAFFGYRCVECGHFWKTGEKALAIHHVNFNKQTCCDGSIPLFVPLCPSCHAKTQTNRIFWQYWFTEMITSKYDGKCYFSKEEMTK